MIRPGLERISRLLQGVNLTWKAIHVAGTNGKGSICAYLSAMLHDHGVRVGRFTSPHIIDRWDGITIDEKTVSESLFLEVEDRVKWKNEKESINASSFELLTATAFEIFNQEKIRVGIVECGMGGRLDATNVLQKPLVTVISRLGMDHEAFLGDTPAKIAAEKCGIMKAGTPCVVDSGNGNAFGLPVLEQARQKGVDVFFTPPRGTSKRAYLPQSSYVNDFAELFKYMESMPHHIQQENMWCAYRAFTLAMPRLNITDVSTERLAEVMHRTVLPGRFQTLDLTPLTGKKSFAFLDGGHNAQSWNRLISSLTEFLGEATARRISNVVRINAVAGHGRQSSERVWVISCSKGRKPEDLIRHISPSDRVFVVEFGPVAGMPWVEPLPATEYSPIRDNNPLWTNMGSDIGGALKLATIAAHGNTMIITGSLYLASDVLRLLRDAGSKSDGDDRTVVRFPAHRMLPPLNSVKSNSAA